MKKGFLSTSWWLIHDQVLLYTGNNMYIIITDIECNIYRLIHGNLHIGLVIIPRPPYCPKTPMYWTIYYIPSTSRKETPILAWDEVEAHIGPGQYGPPYGNNFVVIQYPLFIRKNEDDFFSRVLFLIFLRCHVNCDGQRLKYIIGFSVILLQTQLDIHDSNNDRI